MTLKELFELIPELSKIFYGSQELVTKYMMNTYVCFHVTDQQVSQHSGFFGEARQNASTVLVSLSYPLPNVDETRFKVVSITDEAELELLVRSFSYQIVQLAIPIHRQLFQLSRLSDFTQEIMPEETVLMKSSKAKRKELKKVLESLLWTTPIYWTWETLFMVHGVYWQSVLPCMQEMTVTRQPFLHKLKHHLHQCLLDYLICDFQNSQTVIHLLL